MFDIPDGLVNFQHSDVPTGDASDYLTDEEIETDDLSDSEVLDDTYLVDELDETGVPELDFPDTFTILSQTIRTQPNGMQVIDVVIEVESVAGALNYEVRAVKM
jgi:hypothetical protein